jgi:porphobilinogen synthase
MKHSTNSKVPGAYPRTRLRRNRQQEWCRRLVAETTLSPSDLIWPLFVQEGKNRETPVASMPGVARHSIDKLARRAKEASDAGIPAVALFPSIDAKLKTEDGREAFNEKNLICRAIRAVKDRVPGIGVIADVALDPFTSHGHDGIVHQGDVDNDATLLALCRQAIAQARAGCDIIAPSDMMDGRVGAIRDALDGAGFAHVKILAYSAKYASSLYGPFREAVGSARALGRADKRTYQMDPANGDEAMREVALDVAEGADMVMVKPGLFYLDVIRRVSHAFPVPVLAYQVSGEYAMIHAAGKAGVLDAQAVMLESIVAFRRAGARAVLTYGALEIAQALRGS